MTPTPYDQRVVHVLLVEDDVAISEPLARALSREGYDVMVTSSGLAALDLAVTDKPDLMVLDLGLPELDGLEVCRRLRSRGATLPVLVLTARSEELDAVVGLDAGADDYVTKPFRLSELLARVRALLRRGGADPLAIEVQDLQIDPSARRAWLADTELALTHNEFDLLTALAGHAGSVLTREALMRDVWETDWMGSSKTLDMHVSWLRRKLGDDATSPRYISTVRGVGFRFERD